VSGNGVVVSNAAWNMVGGTNTGVGNIISSQGGAGVVIGGSSACFNLVQGNFIGTDITGTNAAKCNGNGITLFNAPSNTIGGLTFSAANVIAYNGQNGIAISGLTAVYNSVQGNFIGTDLTGTLNLKNNQDGVITTTAINNLVGGPAPGAGNTIAFNNAGGVVVSGGQCAILGNSLFSNGGNPGDISLLNGGNPNAVPPVLTGVTNNTGVTQIQGALTNYPGNTYRIEFYASPNSADAKTFLGATNVVTSATGVALFNIFLPTGILTNQYVTATATDSSGDTSELSASKAVTCYAAPLIVSGPQSQTVTQGMNVALSVVLAGTPPFSYQWQLAGQNIAGATNSTLAFTNVQLNQAGNYQATFANAVGSATTAPALLIVVLPTTTNSPTMQSLVVHLTFDQGLTDSSGRGNHAAAVGAPNFVPGFIGAQAFNPFTQNGTNNYATFKTPSDLFFGATNDFSIAFWARLPTNGWSGSSYFEPPFICNKNFDTYANVGWTLAAGPGGRFEWNYSEGTAINYFGPGGTFGNPTWHHVAVTFHRGGNGIAYVDGVPVSTNSIAPGGQTIDSGLPTNIGNDGTGAYPATYGYFTNIFGIPTNGLGMDDLGIWRRALLPTEIGAIYNAGLAGQDLSTVTTANLTTTVLPRITQQPVNLQLNAGSNATFSVTASGPAPFGYQWFGNGLPIAGANGASLVLSNVQLAQASSYFVLLTNPAASLTSAVATLTVDAPPSVTAQPQSQAVAVGQSASFSLVAIGTAPLSYLWKFSGTALPGATSSILTLNSVQTNNTGSYTVVVANPWGSVTSAVATLAVTNPNITLSPSGGRGMTSSGFAFQCSVPVGCTYVILASTNLQDWTPISTNVALTGSVVLTDSGATNSSRRFYRAMVQ
jgi:hypothetical protein